MNVEEIIKTKKKMPLPSRTLIHLMLVNNKIVERITWALKPFGVSLQQFNVLRILRGQGDQPANLSTLNERMVSKMSNTTRLVDKLLSKGLVDRSICEANRRKVEITITGEGLAVLEEMDAVMQRTEAELVADLSEEELKELNTLLNKF
ncbi:DNA-binding transcriptional regulator, MarR family [Muriicola jejuensis]|uniref:MarR family transcriptional regulator n=1 Tax=Muriicola jejuensis TaxID=504488 RepID=A0A6P0U9G9_9FLAO|nr:MarR family transcriptional regulator [Muriicola jejuensis]NER09212.1 MarR family transcriptional regulator [Muriicola jejuensis]SMP10226.1 DNA-binding transcriptional regulator, MarR family [Muriicola jejuensis]